MINWDATVRIFGPKEYVDRWRILLWKKAFLPILSLAKGPKFVNGSIFTVFDGGAKAIKCIFYMYLSFHISNP